MLSVGCDLGGTHIKVVLLQGRRIVFQAPADAPRKSNAVLDAITALIDDAFGSLGGRLRKRASPEPVATCGVAVPGFLDVRRRRVEHLANLPELDGLPLASRLERRLHSRAIDSVVLDTDSNAGAYAEALLGAGRKAKRVLYLSLGTGLGAAFVDRGHLVRVANHTVGQVAHLPLDPGGRRCRCGLRGCAEASLAAEGICLRARQLGLPLDQRRTPLALYRAAVEGSKGSLQVFRETGHSLGRLAAALSNFLSPDCIVLGGGISQAADLMLPAAGRTLQRQLHPRLRAHVTLVRSCWGVYAGAVGAALLGSAECGV